MTNAVMEDRCSFFNSSSYYDEGIEKRENLKANSSGSSRSLPGSRTSFFCDPLISLGLNFRNKLRQDLLLVAEPAEIPIFRTPEAAQRQMERFKLKAKKPRFFNST